MTKKVKDLDFGLPNMNKYRQVGCRMDPELFKEIEKLAKKNKVSYSRVIQVILEDYLYN